MATSFSSHAREKIKRFLNQARGVEGFWNPLERAPAWAELAEKTARELLEKIDELIPLIGEAHGFSPAESRRAVRRALEPVTAEGLMALWRKEVESKADSQTHWPNLTVIFGGGAIPQPTVQEIIAAGMISRYVIFRPSADDPILAERFIQTMGRDSEERILCVTWPHDDADLTNQIISGADSLVIFGDQPTVDDLGRRASPHCQRFIYGPRLSFAVMDLTRGASGSEMDQWARKFADDVAAYDQRGCLSPSALYLIGGSNEKKSVYMHSLADALDEKAHHNGFTRRLPAGAAMAIRSLRAVYSMDPGNKRSVFSSGGLPGWTLLYDETETSLRPTPGYQTLFVFPVTNWEHVLQSVVSDGTFDSSRPRLQGMGLAPDATACPQSILAELEKIGLSRVCPLGQMQNPPLDWTHDGNPFFPWRF